MPRVRVSGLHSCEHGAECNCYKTTTGTEQTLDVRRLCTGDCTAAVSAHSLQACFKQCLGLHYCLHKMQHVQNKETHCHHLPIRVRACSAVCIAQVYHFHGHPEAVSNPSTPCTSSTRSSDGHLQCRSSISRGAPAQRRSLATWRACGMCWRGIRSRCTAAVCVSLMQNFQRVSSSQHV